MSLSQHNPSNGKTVLRHWIRLPSNCSESSSLAVVKIFLEKGDPQLRILDDSGFTPLLEASNILEIIAWNHVKQSPKFSVFNLLLERDDILSIEKIEAMELAGAEILGDPFYASQFPKAFEFSASVRSSRLR